MNDFKCYFLLIQGQKGLCVQINGEIDRQKDRQTKRLIDKKINRQKDKKAERQMDKMQIFKKIYVQTKYRYIDKKKHKQRQT